VGNLSQGITPEELDDLAWALADAFPEVEVNLSGAQDFWEAKATQLLPVINKLRSRARNQGYAEALVEVDEDEGTDYSGGSLGRTITLDEALEKAEDPTPQWQHDNEEGVARDLGS
jgi:hypothetical protein